MAKKKKDLYRFESTNIITYIYKHFKILALVSAAAFVIAVIVSLTIPNKFKSTTTFFPAATTSVAKNLLDERYNAKNGILDFGEEEEAERMLELLGSQFIQDNIISKYQLINHYKINMTKSGWQVKFNDVYESNISFKRNKNLAIVISVLDENPDMAANIANSMVELLDQNIKLIRKDRADKALALVEHEFNEQEDYINSIQDSLGKLMKLGVNDYKSQSERLYEGYSNALISNNSAALKTIEKKLEQVGQYGEAYINMFNMYGLAASRLTEIRSKYKIMQAEARQELPELYIVNKAYPAYGKDTPKRSIIVIIATLSTFLFALILLMINDTIKRYKKSEF